MLLFLLLGKINKMEMKLLIIGDLHGNLPEKIINAGKKADVILCSGDFANADKIRKLIFSNWGEKWFDIIGVKEARKLEKESFKSGLKILKELNKLNKKVYLVFGNADFYTNYSELNSEGKRLYVGNYKKEIRKLKNLHLIHKKRFKINNIEIIGFGGYVDSTEYIVNKIDSDKEEQEERERRYKEDEKSLFRLMKKAGKNIIFLSHYPAYKLFDKVKHKNSPMNNKHLGFLPYNKIIKKYSPLLFIHGHMHEYQGKKKIGKTMIINPGYGRDSKFAMIEIEGESKKIKSIEFVR